jgi:hypothetical protein
LPTLLLQLAVDCARFAAAGEFRDITRLTKAQQFAQQACAEQKYFPKVDDDNRSHLRGETVECIKLGVGKSLMFGWIHFQDEEYVEEGELAPENDGQHDDESSSTTTTTTETPKVVRPIFRPFRSNEELLSALKKRRLSEKNSKPSGESWLTLWSFPATFCGWPKPCPPVRLFGCLSRFGLVNEIHALRDPTRLARPISLGEIRLNYRCTDAIIRRCTRVELTVKTGRAFSGSDVRQIMHSSRELLAQAIHLDFHASIYASFSAAEQVSLWPRRAISFWTCFYCTIRVSWFRWTSKRRETRFG